MRSHLHYTERFIARRISSSPSGDGGPGVMVAIARISVAIGLAVMIVALGVVVGFKRELEAKLVGFGGDVQIVCVATAGSMESATMLRDSTLEASLRSIPDLASLSAFAIKGGVLKGKEAIRGMMLKGVDGGYDWRFFESNLKQGELPDINDTLRNKDLLISSSLASLLQVEVGDKVEMIFVTENILPRRDLFKICGFYDTGFEEMDKHLALTDIRNIQRLNSAFPQGITGYEITSVSTDKKEVARFVRQIEERLYASEASIEQGLISRSSRERFPALYDWLKVHDVNALVIIVIMLMVSLLNMTAALLIILLERTRMIGILRALGMGTGSLRRVFLIRSSRIVLTGMLWGNLVGLGICALQHYTRFIKLDAENYFLDAVPIAIDWGWWLALNAGAYLFIVGLMLLPMTVIARITPDKTIRYS